MVNFDDYPDLLDEDRAVIASFFSGELLQDGELLL
jgi:hypothetical protein